MTAGINHLSKASGVAVAIAVWAGNVGSLRGYTITHTVSHHLKWLWGSSDVGFYEVFICITCSRQAEHCTAEKDWRQDIF